MKKVVNCINNGIKATAKKCISFVEKNKIKITVVIILFFAFTVWMIWSNLTVGKHKFSVSSEALPEAFDGFRIAHISDFHNSEFGTDNVKLLDKLRDANPDIIVITGDSIDSRRTDIDLTLDFVEDAMDIAQCYLVMGNHESRIKKSEFRKYEKGLIERGVIVLHNEISTIEIDGQKISIAGVDDPSFYDDDDGDDIFLNKLKNLCVGDGFTILLSHRPEYYEEYVKDGYNLVLAGHVHGGQFRLPLIGGLYGPNQGWLPKYDAGMYRECNTTMIVSRGIGNSAFPIRFNNRPELVIIDLSKDIQA